MWSLTLFALAAVAVVAAVECLLLPHLVVQHVVEGSPDSDCTQGEFRPGAMPVWLAAMAVAGYLFFAGWQALSPGGNDAGVYVTWLVAFTAYEVVAHKLPGRRRLKRLPRFAAALGIGLGTLLWLIVHW